MDETPSALDRSVPIMAMTMAIDIGLEMSKNSFHPLMALFFNTSLNSILPGYRHLSR